MSNIRSNESVDIKENPDKRNAPGITSTQYLSILFSSAVADAILPIFYIFIPIFAVKILGANALELGLVGGASYAVYSFMPFIMGHFSDRRGSRKFFILSSVVLLCIVSLLYSITSSPVTLIVIRLFEGTGWAMLWPAIEAAITEDAFRESKKSLSVFNFTWSGGAALGPVIGTFLVSVYSYRFAFFATGILFAILIVTNSITFFRNKTSRAPNYANSANTERLHVSLSSSIRKVLFSPDKKQNFRVWTCLVATILSALTSGVFFTFFGPYATSLGLAVVLIGAITTTYGVVRFFTYVVFAKESLRNRLFDPSKRNRNAIAFASLACLSTLILVIKDHSGIIYFVSFALFAIGYSLVYSISQATLIAETSREQMGAGAGLFESSIGIGGAIGPIVAGTISSSSLAISFIVPAAGLVFALAFLFVLSSLIAKR
ncbi:MAG: MFS transporter [archaeon]|nr:MFS transporter [archaeon]